MVKNILIVTFLLILFALIYLLFLNNPPPNTVQINLKGQKFQLEVAKTVPQQTKGLMDRTSICQNCGMVFVFSLEIPQVFWMKDTLIPLDMIFLDHTGTIINIVTATPEPRVSDSKLTLYRSASPAKYVIELNAGVTGELDLKSGNIIDIPTL